MTSAWIGASLALGICLAPVFVFAQPPVQNGGGGTILVDIPNLRNDTGLVRCALYNSADGFPEDETRIYKSSDVKPHDHHATCRFHQVPPGTYAVAVLHDENENGDMDTNLLGIPQEGYGFSNDAKAFLGLGPPSFNAASFDFAGKQKEFAIDLSY